MLKLQDYTRAQLAELLAPLLSERQQRSRIYAKQIFNWVYQRFVWEWQAMSDLPQMVRDWLTQNMEIFQLDEFTRSDSDDGTLKFLWKLPDHKTIESVLIPAKKADSNRLTLCISSQVGCAMACKFCLTGVQGLDRHLAVHEIVAQVMLLRKQAPVTNIVFMGMGEPLHNVDNVITACQILLDQEGMNFSKRKITVSTSGIVPAITKLGAEAGVLLAVSLNATHDEQREQIMPVNKKWDIATLLSACQEYPSNAHRMVTYEYVLLKDFNDTLEDAKRLHELVRRYPAKVNLIPFNEHPAAPFKRPSGNTVSAFHDFLVSRGVVATVRHSRGRDILAACGQLRSLFGTARGTDKHQDEAYRANLTV